MAGIASNSIIYSGKQYTLLVFGLVRNMLLAHILGQSDYSYWVLFQVFMGYVDLVHLGLRTAASREIPILNGAGEQSAAARFRSAVFGGTIVLSVVVAAVLVVAGSLVMNNIIAIEAYDNTIIAQGLYLSALLVIAEQVSRYFLTLLRTEHKFVRVSIIEVVYDLGRTGLIALLALQLAAPGAVGGYVVAVVVLASYFLVFNRPPRPTFNLSEISDALKIGIPLFFASVSTILMVSIDRILAASVLAPNRLSVYGFAIPMSLLPVFALQSIRDVLFPSFGELTADIDTSPRFATLYGKAIRLSAILAPIMTIAMLVVIEPVVVIFVPKFVQSIDVMYWIAGATVIFGLGAIPNSVLLVLRKQWAAFSISIISGLLFILFVAGTHIAAWDEYASLIIGAWISYSVYTALTVRKSLRVLDKKDVLSDASVAWHIIKSILPSIAAIAGALMVRTYVGFEWLPQYLVQLAVLAAGVSTTLLVNRDLFPEIQRILGQLIPGRKQLNE